MPKKPFTAEEIAAQRERIMDSASSVMAEVGFHHLSMRKLASQLGMTASNIYNYFPDKETLFIHTRRRGFDLAFADINEQMVLASNPTQALYTFARQLIAFAQRYPGYYQLMFQPPLLSLDETESVDQEVQLQVERLVEEWQQHLLSLLADAIPLLAERPEAAQKQLALFFVASIHGLIDSYRYRALPLLLAGLDLIPDDVVQEHIGWLLNMVERQAEQPA
ncbi:MAG: TetR/AcrR family transcriptional regulator [Pseudomonadota bacterium]|nr:TetR/AcrR family transcriptional regulator [Pseudomonadota bacterium]